MSKCERCGYDFGDHSDRWTMHAHSSDCITHLKSEVERLREERDNAREAARWWYRRDRRSHDPSVITDQLQLWPWLEEGR